jgi:formate-dependent nitrite reductase cytochrome c552 subunit
VRLRVFGKYAEDEANTRTQTVLMMMLGGGKIAGIHGAHVGAGTHIRFAVADPKRQTIPWVEYRNTTTGDVQTFLASDAKPESVTSLPTYEMQCVDCHNRPTHTFDLPDRAMDKALAAGDISVSLPYVKKEGVELLKASYATSEEANSKLPIALTNFYQQKYPDVYAKRSQDVAQASQAVLGIYSRNVFPDLKVAWGTYPNNLGHTDFPGCFRCHDGSHTSSGGKTIKQECNTCHEPLAMDETSPEILKTLGLSDRISSIQKQ